MFSGKSTELIRRINREKSIHKRILVINFIDDNVSYIDILIAKPIERLKFRVIIENYCKSFVETIIIFVFVLKEVLIARSASEKLLTFFKFLPIIPSLPERSGIMMMFMFFINFLVRISYMEEFAPFCDQMVSH
jgi:hypothetical protein